MDAAAILTQIYSTWLSGAIGTMGFAIVLLSLRLAWRSARLSRGELVTGKIVRWRRVSDSESGDHYAPVVSFTPRGSSKPVEVQPQHDFRSEPGATGEFIELRYDPANPLRAESASAARQWFGVACILLLGLGTLFTAYLIGGS